MSAEPRTAPLPKKNMNPRQTTTQTQLLEYNTVISPPSRNSSPIEIFQQWNGIFAADACQFFEICHTQAIAPGSFVFGKQRPGVIDSLVMKDHIAADLQKHPLAQQQLENLLSLAHFQWQSGEHGVDSWRGETAARKLPLNLLFCPGLAGL